MRARAEAKIPVGRDPSAPRGMKGGFRCGRKVQWGWWVLVVSGRDRRIAWLAHASKYGDNPTIYKSDHQVEIGGAWQFASVISGSETGMGSATAMVVINHVHVDVVGEAEFALSRLTRIV